MAAATRARTSRQSSSPAGEATAVEPDGLEEEGFEDDLCGQGCHVGGVAPGSVSVGCEHGTYQVSEKHWRKPASDVSVRPETVHDRSIHHEPTAKAAALADGVALQPLVDQVNAHDERIATLELQVRQLATLVQALVDTDEGDGDETATGGE
jgi:hypothetical protein